MSDTTYNDDTKFHADVKAIFATDEGQRVLAELELKYCRRVLSRHGDPNETLANAARSDLIQLFRQLYEEPIYERDGERPAGFPKHVDE